MKLELVDLEQGGYRRIDWAGVRQDLGHGNAGVERSIAKNSHEVDDGPERADLDSRPDTENRSGQDFSESVADA